MGVCVCACVCVGVIQRGSTGASKMANAAAGETKKCGVFVCACMCVVWCGVVSAGLYVSTDEN